MLISLVPECIVRLDVPNDGLAEPHIDFYTGEMKAITVGRAKWKKLLGRAAAGVGVVVGGGNLFPLPPQTPQQDANSCRGNCRAHWHR